MKQLSGIQTVSPSSGTIADPLRYQNRLRFPGSLEAAYRHDFAARSVTMQRHFIAFGFVIFGLFAILDYFAMPRTHLVAWRLRALMEPLTIALFWLSFRPWFRDRMYWLMNLWVLLMNVAILGMISVAQESELAFTFYPIGLMLVLVSGYVASGHLWYATAQGWLAILGYVFVGVFDQRMLVGHLSLLKFFTLNFFLVGMNLVGMSLAYVLERSNRLAFLQGLVIQKQHEETNRLLLNVLPDSIAQRLKRGEAVADHFDEAGILFADIQGFTPYSAGRQPAEVVAILNRIFSAFDGLAERYGLEKIKTIGDAYMVVSGVPLPRSQHLEALANMALDMRTVMEQFRRNGLCDLRLRIGIAAGPVVAGIIGLKKFSYDLWGDTVNVASRMESFGIPGEIQATREVYHLLRHKYLFEQRGLIEVKGKGQMLVYLLRQRREANTAERVAVEPTPLPDGTG